MTSPVAATTQTPPLQWRGVLKMSTVTDPEGSVTTIFRQSPMMDRDTAAEYVGLGVNQFTTSVREGLIRKRGASHHPFHVDDLDEYLESLAESA